MKSIWDNIQSIIIVILIIIILFLTQCSGTDEPIVKKEVVTQTEIKYDTIRVENEVEVIKWKWKIKTDTIEKIIPQDVDTLDILKDYYTKYFYIDTINIDTVGYIVINDTIQKNSILNRKTTSEIVIPTKEILKTDVIYINEYEFYTGPNFRIGGGKVDYMGIEGTLRGVNGNLFTVGAGVNNENKFSIGGGVLWKIKK